ncbi:hypothetical protein SAMN05518672_10317 [Chitinophaga sp. CF118]|uniref:contractile injection system tape measure protein n=1 Tax=Chitinophaga sp. CF118 TaxID=1884367 RepID=UPI0008EEFD44|nr:contractile injection system tape measure protein [Chitinophaga sp. CF118]SFD73968.1 hypothetical protein SAMN05518672_10317 [Chitinophaga sp. CF118]
MEQQHAIGKLLLEVQLPSRQEAFSLQSRLSSRCTTELLPLLAELLDSWTDPGVLLQIDKLEIDLGSCSLETLEKELPHLIIEWLRKRYPGIRQEAYLEEGMERVPVGQGYFESWLYFLEHGVLPHAAIRWQRQEWETGILETLSAETQACRLCQELLLSTPDAVKRLVLQFSPEFVQNWLLAYSASVYQPLLQLVTELETVVYHPQLLKTIERIGLQQLVTIPLFPARTDFHHTITVWLIKEVVSARQSDHAFFLKEVIRLSFPGLPVKYWLHLLQEMPSTVMEASPLLQQATLKLADQYTSDLVVLKQELAVKASYNEFKQSSSEIDDVIVKSVDPSKPMVLPDGGDNFLPAGTSPETKAKQSEKESKTLNGGEVKEAPVTGKDNTTSGTEKTENINNTASADEDVEEIEEERKPPAEGTVLYINNAGLILLHPYLGILFDALGLREENHFKDDAALNKAVQLLGYLASGEDEIPEYDLVLPKLLCGILPSQPVKRNVLLTATEKTEADELLLSVISHWSALGSTTPDGLRGSFLMREGKLEWKEEEWQLYVTQQSYDMLLNRLPWGFSVVGLSWMPWFIKTVWI